MRYNLNGLAERDRQFPSLVPLGHRAHRRRRTFELLEGRALLAASISAIAPIPNALTNSTAKDPQSKVWEHNGTWWSVLADATGTAAFRLDGPSWTRVVQLSTKVFTADVKPVGDGAVTYVFLYSAGNPKLAKLTDVSGVYQLTSFDPTTPLASVPATIGSDTGTIEIDSMGRMWEASDTASTIEVHYSDAPYTSWSAPITLATGVADPDLATIAALPGKIGVMWSNGTSQRFGFRTHVDGADPTVWSADEVPAAQSAKLIGNGMSDGHLNVKVASDGTLYAAVKTGYDRNSLSYPEMALLVRHPNGAWDPLYGIDAHGTRPIIELSESQGILRYVYVGNTNVNDIVYKDIRIADINPAQPDKFYSGPDVAQPLLSRSMLIGGGVSKNVSSTRQAFLDELVVVATNAADSTGVGPFSISAAKMTDFTGSLAIADVSVVEGNAGTTNAVFTVTLSPASSQIVTVHFATADGTATAGSDYTAQAGDLTFASGATTATLTVPISGDTAIESHETYFVNLSNPTGAIFNDAQGLGRILNDDTAVIIGGVSIREGNGGGGPFATFPVRLAAASSLTVSVHYGTANGSALAGSDYRATSGVLTFFPGETGKSIAVSIISDKLPEADETFFVQLSSPINASISVSQATGTILNDDKKAPLALATTTKATPQRIATLAAASLTSVTVPPVASGATTRRIQTPVSNRLRGPTVDRVLAGWTSDHFIGPVGW